MVTSFPFPQQIFFFLTSDAIVVVIIWDHFQWVDNLQCLIWDITLRKFTHCESSYIVHKSVLHGSVHTNGSTQIETPCVSRRFKKTREILEPSQISEKRLEARKRWFFRRFDKVIFYKIEMETNIFHISGHMTWRGTNTMKMTMLTLSRSWRSVIMFKWNDYDCCERR